MEKATKKTKAPRLLPVCKLRSQRYALRSLPWSKDVNPACRFVVRICDQSIVARLSKTKNALSLAVDGAVKLTESERTQFSGARLSHAAAGTPAMLRHSTNRRLNAARLFRADSK